MKKQKIRLLLTVIAISFLSISQAQVNTVGEMLSGIREAPDDVNKLFKGYIAPYANAMGANLSAGWYNTAKVHKLGGFDLTFSFNMSFVPTADKTFDLNELDLGATIQGDGIAPTAAGENKTGPLVQYYAENTLTPSPSTIQIAEYTTPKGTGVGFIPTPMMQLGLGLVKGTDVTGRYMPMLNLGNVGKMGLWGIGVKHSIKQWIPVLEKLPVFNLTLFGGYTKFGSDLKLKFEPDDLNQGTLTVTDLTDNTVNFDDQHMLLNIKSFTMSILVSADLPVVCFYGGLGFASTNTELKLEGNYPTPTPYLQGTEVIAAVTNESVVTDPVSITIKSKSGGTTKPRINAGMRIKMGVVTIHGDYTYSNYSIVSAGLGISFR